MEKKLLILPRVLVQIALELQIPQQIPGVGSTDKLPETVFAIKVDEKKIQLAATAENALRTIPIALDFTSVGIGTSHVITSTKQNNKVLISLDNVVQTPIVGTSVTTSLSQDFSISQDIAFFSGKHHSLEETQLRLVMKL